MKKAIRKITIFSLIILLLSAHIVILGETIANALELHNEDTNIKNVKYDAYLKTEEGNKYEKQANISERETLVLNVKVNNQGVLRDAKINIDNTNFNIITEEIESEYIKQISAETNEIELNSIVYSNDVTIEIPIEFKQASSFTQDYFNKDVPVTLTGTYINEIEETVNAQRTIRLNWTEMPETAFIQNIEKYMNLSEGRLLIQQNICTGVQDNILPRQAEKITTKAQEINGVYPKDVVVIANGEKLREGINYDEQNGMLEIINIKKPNENGEIEWGNFINEYNVIYTYETEETAEPRTFNLETTVEMKLYTKSDVIAKESQETVEVEVKGNLVEVTKEATKTLNKGYMYANSNDETTFVESNTIKISKASEIETIEISNQNEIFVDQNNNEYDVTTNMIYKSTTINKNDLEKIFGQTYELKIVDSQNNEIANILDVTESDEAGNITVNYNTEINYIKIITSKPREEGNITIKNTRAIKGNTGYTKDQLKSFNKIVLNCNVTNGENTAESKTEIILNDTVTEAKMEISNTNLSAAQRNQDVQFLVTLLSDSAKYDLYKNPVVDIVLPQELNIDVKKTAQLNFENEVQITKIGMTEREDNKKVIRINLEGEQVSFAKGTAGGIQMVLLGDIDVENTTETKDETIQLLYSNENSDNVQFTYDVPITITAKPEEIVASEEQAPAMEVMPNEQQGVAKVVALNEEAEDLSISVLARTGDKYLQEGDTVLEGQGIKYILKVTNNTDETMQDVSLEATNTNAIYYNYITYQDNVNGEIMDKVKLVEDESLTSKIIEIGELKAGETREVNYQVSAKEIAEETADLTGEIKVNVNGEEKLIINNITNKIEQGKLKLNLLYADPENEQRYSKELFRMELTIKNISNEDLTDINVELPVSDKADFLVKHTTVDEELGCEFIEYKDNIAKFRIPKLEAGKDTKILVALPTNSIPAQEKEVDILEYFTATNDNTTYTSNEIERKILQGEAQIVAKQTTNIEGNIVKDKDNIKFIIEMENKGVVPANVYVTDIIQLGLNTNNVKIIHNENETEETIDNIFSKSIAMEPNDKVKIIIDTTLESKKVDGNKITNKVSFISPGLTIEADTIEFIIEGKESTNPGSNTEDKTDTNSIKGLAFLDSNKNGNKESNEPILPNIEVMLLDETDHTVAQDKNGRDLETTTNQNGEYEFNNLKNGKYSVIFIYDVKKYAVTQYQKDGISENQNSDVINTKIKIDGKEVQCAKTKELEIKDNNLTNIDAGFIEIEKFDLKLSKYVSKITIQNNKETRTITYDKSQLAKAEIAASRIKGTIVTIEYEIEISNEGDVPGYAREIVDYLPNDLKFDKNQNSNWTQGEKGNVYTTELANQEILPGETKSVKLILTKTMTQENTGTIINKAEISKHYNEYMLNDINSTPANRNEKENDMGRADVIISINTGNVVLYISVIMSAIVAIGVGTYFIKKKVIIG